MQHVEYSSAESSRNMQGLCAACGVFFSRELKKHAGTVCSMWSILQQRAQETCRDCVQHVEYSSAESSRNMQGLCAACGVFFSREL